MTQGPKRGASAGFCMPAYTGDNKACYAYAPGDNKADWKLPICGQDGEPDAGIVGAAAAALGTGFRGNRVELPDGARAAAVRKVRAAWRRVHPDMDPDEMPSGIHLTESGVDDEPDEPITMAASEPLGAVSADGLPTARPLLFSFDQEWIPFLPKPGKYAHSVYGDLNLTPDKYDRILANFNANVYKQDIPINVEHDSRAAGAVGWVKPGGMRLAADGSLEVKPDWNDTGRALIDGDRFRYVSAEFANRWQDPVSREWHQDVVVGLAICTRPHFKTDVLQPLAASEGAALVMAQSLVSAGEPGEETTMPEEQKTQETPPVATAAATTQATPVVTQPVSLMDVVITAEQRAIERQQFADLTARVELAERRAQTAETRLATREAEMRKERFLSEVMGRSSQNGDKWLCHKGIEAEVATLTEMADKLGDDSPILMNYIEQKRNEIRAVRATGVFDPISVSARGAEGDVMAQVKHLADEKRKVDQKLTPEQAETQVFNEQPDLYMRYLGAKR